MNRSSNRKNSLEINTKILIADKELITALDLKQFLENAGYYVLPIINKKEKLIRVALSERPALIITDTELDDISNGISAINEINRTVSIPYIYLTASSMFNPNIFTKVLGSLAVLNKPIDYNRLLHHINKKLSIPYYKQDYLKLIL